MLPRRTNWLTVSLLVVSSVGPARAQEEPVREPAGPPVVLPAATAGPGVSPSDGTRADGTRADGTRADGTRADGEPPIRQPSEPSAASPTPAAHRPLGPQLFPFYTHYVRGEDETRVRNILYLFQTTEGQDGSSSDLLVPFYYRRDGGTPPESRLHLYPLLYFHKSSAEESYNYALPLVYDHRTPDSSFQLVFPFWMHRATENRQLSRHHVLFPFFRHTSDRREPGRPLDTTRLGLWKVLELWESRSGPETFDRKALTFFNWRDDALGGLSVYSSSWVGRDDAERGQTHLFPFYWHGREADSHARVLFPFYWQGASASTSHLWVVPFFGSWRSEDARRFFVIPLLSGFGSGPGTTKSFWTLPLFTYENGPEHFGFGTLLGGYWRTRESSFLNVLLFGYLSRHTYESGKRSHSVLFPLSHFDVEPDGSQGVRWVFPYFESFDDDDLWRVVAPLYVEHQARTGGEMDSYLQTAFPLYWSWGEPEDHFSMGFPLYWASRSGPRGWRVFFPLFGQSYNATSSGTHVPLVFSYRSFPSRKQLALGGPLYINERTYDIDGELSGQSHNLLWPFIKAGWGRDGHDFRLLPLFWTSRDGEATDLLIGPYYRQTGPDGSHNHFFPLYGRYQSDSLTRDYYGAGALISSLHRDEAGEPAYKQHDYLWKLASFQTSLKSDASHQHVLPLAFWRTRSEERDRTVAGPLYYSHRIRDDEQEHSLRLFLGNLFLTKTTSEWTRVERKAVADPTALPAEEAAVADPADASGPEAGGSDAGDPEVTADEPENPPAERGSVSVVPGSLHPLQTPTFERRVVKSEKGVLWPLSRSYSSADEEVSGSWVLPFYFDRQDRFRSQRAVWPLYFAQKDQAGYDPSYYRYFFLYDHENWDGGYRRTFGQLLFDWKHDEKRNTRRWRFLYPLLEHERSDNGYSFGFLKPLLSVRSSRDQGEHVQQRHLFPLYWQGARERENAEGEWVPQERHLFVLPLFGVHSRSTRTDYFALFPFIHVLHSKEALNFELWPFLFGRNEPGLKAFRLWPLHTNERGELAGDFWVSRFVFFSKYFSSTTKRTYRLDPFLFEYTRTPEERRSNALFHLYENNRSENESWFHLFPIFFKGKKEKAGFTSLFPLYYGKNFGEEKIDYLVPWRFFSAVNHLQQEDGERHTSLLWKLFEYTDNTSEPDFHDVRILHALYLDRKTPTSRQFAINPLFSYYRDENEDETQLSFLLSLYSYRKVKGAGEHTFLYFLRF